MTFQFFAGAAVGLLTPVAFGAIGYSLRRMDIDLLGPSTPLEKLAEARRYLAIIASTPSLHHAQKTAHEALRVTE